MSFIPPVEWVVVEREHKTRTCLHGIRSRVRGKSLAVTLSTPPALRSAVNCRGHAGPVLVVGSIRKVLLAWYVRVCNKCVTVRSRAFCYRTVYY